MSPLAPATQLMLEEGLNFVKNNPHDEIFSLQDTTDESKLCRLLDQPLSVLLLKIPALESENGDSRSCNNRLKQNLRTARKRMKQFVELQASSRVAVAFTVTPPPVRASSRIHAPFTAPKAAKKSKRAKPANRDELESFDTKLGKLADFQLSFAESMQHMMEYPEMGHLSFTAKQRVVNDKMEAEIDGIKAELAEIKRGISYNVTTHRRRG